MTEEAGSIATGDAVVGPSVVISPLAGLRGVLTIPAIMALRDTGLLGLKEAKTLVERMVVEGAVETGLGRYAGALSDPDVAEQAVVAERALAAAGVSLVVEGVPLSDWLDGMRGPGPA